jgi:hydroxymethylbilane synthase
MIDAAVHSLKDLPTSAAPGVTVGAVVARDDPREALVTGSGLPLGRLAVGARVGTSSLRRRAQLLSLRPDLGVTDIRGNVPTRIAKVTSGEYDAVLLAHAGLIRLGLTAQVAQIFDDDVVVPAPGQGALAVQARADDDGVLSWLSAIDDGPTRLATLSERSVLAALRGGCQAPLGALAKWDSPGHLRLSAIVAAVDRPSVLRATDHGVVETQAQAIALGEAVADALCKLGAGAVLKAARDWVAAADADAGDAA